MSYSNNSLLPAVLEDRTGLLSNTDFDDLYDRDSYYYYHVNKQPGSPLIKIFRMNHRSTTARLLAPLPARAVIHLEYPQDQNLGTITFCQDSRGTMQMSQYLRKLSFFGSSLNRKFRALDGYEYMWDYRQEPGQEWTLWTMGKSAVVAYYILKANNDPKPYDVSGNELTVNAPFCDTILADVIASLLIMRHIATYNL